VKTREDLGSHTTAHSFSFPYQHRTFSTSGPISVRQGTLSITQWAARDLPSSHHVLHACLLLAHSWDIEIYVFFRFGRVLCAASVTNHAMNGTACTCTNSGHQELLSYFSSAW